MRLLVLTVAYAAVLTKLAIEERISGAVMFGQGTVGALGEIPQNVD